MADEKQFILVVYEHIEDGYDFSELGRSDDLAGLVRMLGENFTKFYSVA